MVAPTPVITTLVDSYNDIIIKITIPTGGDADLSASKVLDISTYTTGRTSTQGILKKIHSSLVGFSAILLEDANTDSHLISIPEYVFESDDHPWIPMARPTGATGDLNLTTIGIGAADHGTIIIHLLKV